MKILLKLFFPSLLTNELKADLFRYYGSTDRGSFSKALRVPGFEFTVYFRLASSKSKYSLLGAVSRMQYKKLMYKYGFQIPRTTKIAPGLRISHFGGVVINYDAVIGRNCYLSHNVTIGHTQRGEKRGTPVVGNGVWIGPGAVVIGKITIGDNVLIAGNAFVNMDVPADSIVIGNPGKIISNKDATKDYVTHIYPLSNEDLK